MTPRFGTVFSAKQALTDLRWAIHSPNLVNWEWNWPHSLTFWEDAAVDPKLQNFLSSLLQPAGPGTVDHRAVPPDPAAGHGTQSTEPPRMQMRAARPNSTRRPSQQGICAQSGFVPARGLQQVGRWFEMLVRFYLAHIQNAEIVAANRVVKTDNRTRGELDFVFRDHKRQLWHWETAVKFYLYRPEEPTPDRQFAGPNPADSLLHKLQRLEHHQLPLARTVYPQLAGQTAWLKGRIFYPVNMSSAERPARCGAYLLNPGHATGRWMRHRDLADYADTHVEAEFRLLAKPHWLAPPCPAALSDQHGSAMPAAQAASVLRDHFSRSARPVQVSVRNRESHSAEDERLLIVSDDWPNDGR